MKKTLILCYLSVLCLISLSQTYSVQGNAFLEGTTDHTNIIITFNRTAPTSLSYTFYTDISGYFSEVVLEGIYNITYEKSGFISQVITNVSIYSALNLSDVTLEIQGLSGDIYGTLAAGTYKVSGDIEVPTGQSLYIEPGTILKFQQDVFFIVRGSLYANGNDLDSIIMTRYDNGITWGGFNIFNSVNTSLSYARVEYSTNSGIYADGNCWFDHIDVCRNTGDDGGGIHIAADDDYTINITNSRIFNNNADGDGGGIYIMLSTSSSNFQLRPVFGNCLIFDNTADNGAGIFFDLWYYSGVRRPLVTNCVISSNICTNNSAAIDCDPNSNGIPILVNNIISHNTGYGTNFSTYFNQYFGYNNSFENSLGSYHNPPVNVGNIVTSNANGDPCDAYHNIQLDPIFTDINNFDFHLLDGSPCIDVGLNDSAYWGSDFDNNPRIVDGNNYGIAVVDMGSYEYGTIIGINESVENQNEMNWYPNPTQGKLYINKPDYTIHEITVSDLEGRNLLQLYSFPSEGIIDLTGFERGVYLITVKTSNTVFSNKVIKY